MNNPRHQKSDARMFCALPPGWRDERLYDVVELRTSNVDKKSAEAEMPVKLCNYVDVYHHDRVTSGIDFMEATAAEAQIERFSLKVGDVVITKDSESPYDIGVPALVAESIPNLVCGYHLTILRPVEPIVIGGYLFYALTSRLSAYQFCLASNGVTRFGLTYQGTKNVRIAFPSVADQQKIADFLDWKTGQIDTLMERKRALVEKLKEKRLAVITQAVTRGLNPSAPVRETGIPWLGPVPEHWGVKRLKFHVERVFTGSTPPSGESQYYEEPTVNWFTPSDFTDEGAVLTEANRKVSIAAVDDGVVKSFQRPCVLIVGIGATLGRVGIVDGLFTCNQQINVVVPAEGIDAKFLFYSLLSKRETMTVISNATTLGILNQETTRQIEIPAPAISEQAEISCFLDGEVHRIDCLISKVESAVVRLTEYRTALITAATTGKIDVRKVAMPIQG